MRSFIGRVKRAVVGYIQNICEGYGDIPSEVARFSIGESVQGCLLRCFQIGEGKYKILYVAGIHGNEVGTVKLAHHLIHFLHSRKEELRDFTIFVVPSLNPDGHALARSKPDYVHGGRLGRCNANNVDLNRNFDTPSFQEWSHWSFGKDYSQQEKVFCGKRGTSEPETRALTTFIQQRGISTLFMLHNAGSDVMGNRNARSQKLTKLFAEVSGFRYVSEDDWLRLKQTGTAKEWCDLHGIAYVEIEGSTRWGSDWRRQKNALYTTLLEARQLETAV